MDPLSWKEFEELPHDQKVALAKKEAAHAPKPLPELMSFTEFCEAKIVKPAVIIHGLFDQASSMIFGGGSKTFKSWAMMDLAVSITNGVPWWGFGTVKGAVIYCNFELKPYYCRERLLTICKAKGVPLMGELYVWNLRGHKIRILDFLERLVEDIERYKVVCVFVDPFYKLLGDKDERISAELMPILEGLEEISAKTSASTVCAAHYTKGNQASKDPLDRISGGGALNRHPDVLITLTKNEVDEAFSIDIIARDFAPVDPFAVSWRHPLFKPDPTIDPSKLKGPKKSGGQPYDEQSILKVLEQYDDQCSTTQLQEMCDQETGISKAQFYRLWALIKSSKKVFLSKMSGKWNLKNKLVS